MEDNEPAKQSTSVRQSKTALPWSYSLDAIKNTINYVFNVIRHPCYLVGIYNHRVFYSKLTPMEGTPQEYVNWIKKEIERLKLENSPEYDKVSKLLNKTNVRIMQCIIKDYTDKNDPIERMSYNRIIQSIKDQLNDGIFIFNLNDTYFLPRMDSIGKIGKLSEPVMAMFEQHQLSDAKFIPVFNGGGNAAYWDIRIPNYDEVERIVLKKSFDENYVDWSSKQLGAVFRGGPTGCGTTVETNQRMYVCSLTGVIPLLDAQLVKTGAAHIKIDPKIGLSKNDQSAIKLGNLMTMLEQAAFKVIIHIDGNVSAYRLLNTMLTGSLILRVMSYHIYWCDDLLEDGVHYIGVKEDMSNFKERLDFVLDPANDAAMKKIAANGREFALRTASEDNIKRVFIEKMNAASAAAAASAVVAQQQQIPTFLSNILFNWSNMRIKRHDIAETIALAFGKHKLTIQQIATLQQKKSPNCNNSHKKKHNPSNRKTGGKRRTTLRRKRQKQLKND